MSDPLLTVDRLAAGYGQMQVLHDVSLTIVAGSITALIGSNGAGKTTLMRALSGLIPVTAGRIEFHGSDITDAPASSRVEQGISLVPEGRLVFPVFSVEENLKVGGYIPRIRARRSELMARMFESFPRLADRRRQLGQMLSGGEQQMLAIARAQMAGPRLLLLDEPSLGLAPQMVAQMFQKIAGVRDAGATVFIVEQKVASTLKLADHAYVMENGRVTMNGLARQILTDPAVKSAYLGS